MMEAIRFSETSVLTRATWRNIPEDGILHLAACLSLPSLLPDFTRIETRVAVAVDRLCGPVVRVPSC
jgi:hypothetical protein